MRKGWIIAGIVVLTLLSGLVLISFWKSSPPPVKHVAALSATTGSYAKKAKDPTSWNDDEGHQVFKSLSPLLTEFCSPRFEVCLDFPTDKFLRYERMLDGEPSDDFVHRGVYFTRVDWYLNSKGVPTFCIDDLATNCANMSVSAYSLNVRTLKDKAEVPNRLISDCRETSAAGILTTGSESYLPISSEKIIFDGKKALKSTCVAKPNSIGGVRIATSLTFEEDGIIYILGVATDGTRQVNEAEFFASYRHQKG